MNVYSDEWEGGRDRPGYTWRTKRLGGELIGASVYEVPPGEKTFPYHFHHANEELLIVLEGEPTLRDPSGERTLARGDAVLFARGPDGAHQLRNDTERPVRLLIASTLARPEAAEYPDSGKLGVYGPLLPSGFYLRSSAVDYYEGEE